ncbi:transcription factor TFIIIC subunit tfc4 [Allomyces javanicus]|nr:transcription factor TFIIIC subunit tfc4 [Allomyces javanicus]
MTTPPPPADSIQAQLEASLFGALEGDPALAPAPAPAAPALPAPPVSPRTAASPFQPFFLVPSTARTSTLAAAAATSATVALPPPPPPPPAPPTLTILTPSPPAPLLHPNAAANSARALDALIGAAPAPAPTPVSGKAVALRRRAKRTRFDDEEDDDDEDGATGGVRHQEVPEDENDDDDIDLDAQYAVGNVANWIHAHPAAAAPPPVTGRVYQPPPPAPLAVPTTGVPQDADADQESYATNPYQHLRDAMDRLMHSASDDNVSDDSQEEFEAVHRDDLRRQSGVGRARGKRRGRRRNDPNAESAVADLIHAANARYVSKDYDAARRACEQAIQLQPRADAAYRVLALVAEEQKDYRRALTMWLFMAHLVPKNYDLWRQLAVVAQHYGTEREVFHCYKKATAADPRDLLVPWHLIKHHDHKGQLSPQIDLYKHLLRQAEHNMVLMRRLVTILQQKNMATEAAVLMNAALTYHAQGKYVHPWVEPALEDLGESLLPALPEYETTLFDRIVFRKQYVLTLPSGSPDLADPELGAMTIDDLFLACDLLFSNNMNHDLLLLIKRVVRFFQGRHTELVPDETVSDAEYNPQLHPRPPLDEASADGGAGMPLEFRVMLGVCRMNLGHVEVAETHFDPLRAYAAADQLELYEMMLTAYTSNRHWAKAADLAATMLGVAADAPVPADPIEEPDPAAAALWYRRGHALAQLGRADAAIAAMERARALDSAAVAPREELADLYQAQGRASLAFTVLSEAEQLMDASHLDAMLFGRRPDLRGTRKRSKTDNGSKQALLKDWTEQASTEKERLSKKSSRKEALLAKEREVRVKFEKLQLMWATGLDKLDDEQKREYLSTATSLFEIFKNTAAFYPSDRSVTFAGVDGSFRIRNTKIAKSKFTEEGEYKLVERRMFLAPRANYDPKDLEKLTQEEKLMIQANSYLGYAMDDWFEMLMRYCVALVKGYQSDRAFSVLHDVADANVFWHDKAKMIRMHVVGMALGVAAARPEHTTTHARWLITHYPYHSNVYRLYAASLCSGARDRLAFASANCQKFFKRMLQHRFAGSLRKSMTPAEVEALGLHPGLTVQDETEAVWTAKPVLLTVYGHILSCAASYLPAAVHYLRAYALAPDDAMLNLTLGVAYLHRAMQRKSDNRHQQVAQGIAFLLRYAEISLAPPAPAAAGEPADGDVPPVFRQPSTLVLYNLGRAFHQIGLVALATRYYRMALDDKSAPQFHREAAYSLALVYTHSNAPRLAKQVMREYLTF